MPIPYEIRTERVRGVITSSLFETVNSIGEEDSLALLLADIFAYDVDFILDIREGDSFQALVEKRYRDGKPAGYGKLLAAEFTNQGTTYQAIRFKDGSRPEAWYAPDGQSRRQLFLRAPLEFSRISSGFTMRRYHPIAKTWRAHPAIDYAAPTGTPIRSVGDGTVIAKAALGGERQLRQNPPYQRLRNHVPAHEPARQHPPGGTRRPGAGDRLRRQHRAGHRAAPVLPDDPQRRAGQSATRCAASRPNRSQKPTWRPSGPRRPTCWPNWPGAPAQVAGGAGTGPAAPTPTDPHSQQHGGFMALRLGEMLINEKLHHPGTTGGGAPGPGDLRRQARHHPDRDGTASARKTLAGPSSSMLGFPCVQPEDYATYPGRRDQHPVSGARRQVQGRPPVRLGGRKLTLAMADPRDIKAIDEISFRTGYIILPVLALEVRLYSPSSNTTASSGRMRYIAPPKNAP